MGFDKGQELLATLEGSARWRLLRGAKPLASYA